MTPYQRAPAIAFHLGMKCTKTLISNGARRADWKLLLKTAEAICFDVDSTVIQEEGIDVLAAYCGAGTAVAEWTRKAMSGNVLFQDALTARLQLIQPSKEQVEQCLQHTPLHLTDGIVELVSELKRLRKEVFLVSGGFQQMILPVSKSLSIPDSHVFANRLIFAADGSFVGFDPNALTSRSGGKRKVVEHLLETFSFNNVVVVGDGVTDMEARPPATLFIGYGGVVVRQPVLEQADHFVYSHRELISALQEEEE